MSAGGSRLSEPIERWLPGYRPRFERSADALPLADLQALIGARMCSFWMLWDTFDDVLFCDAPVVLVLGDARIEVCVDHVDELSITADTIELDVEPAWCGDEDAGLEWQRSFSTPVRRMTGRPLSAVRILERWDAGDDPSREGAWMLFGVEFEFADRSLVVTNGVDENEVCYVRPEGADYRVAAELS